MTKKKYGSIISEEEEEESTTTTKTTKYDGPSTQEDNDDEHAPLISGSAAPKSKLSFLSSIWSILVFQWLEPLLELGNRKEQLDPNVDLTMIDFPLNCTTKHVQEQFDYYWNKELEEAASKKKKSSASPNNNIIMKAPSLARALFYAFGTDFIRAGFLKLCHDVCIFVGPLVLNGLIHFLRDAESPLSHGLWSTAAVTCSQLCMSFCLRHYFFQCYRTGLRIRSSVVMAVYRKALRIKSSSNQSIGAITNLISIDAQAMQDLTTYLHAIWYSFIQIGLAIYFLFQQLGPSCLGGVIVILIMMPITKIVAKWMGKIQRSLMKVRDERVELNTEILTSMRILKFQAWEESFTKRLLKLRNLELKQLWRYIIYNSLSILLWSTTPMMVALATFATYILVAQQQLDVASALTALALFDILRFPLFMFPQVLNRIVEAGISLERLQSFLLSDEQIPIGRGELLTSSPGSIQIQNATFCYESMKQNVIQHAAVAVSQDDIVDGEVVDPMMKKEMDNQNWEIALLKSQLQDAEERIQELLRAKKEGSKEEDYANDGPLNCDDPTHDHDDMEEQQQQQHLHQSQQQQRNLLCLKRIDLNVKQGEFIAIVGGVGCGKSSLLNAILGEVRCLSGTTSVYGPKLSYFAQTPFILNDTVRNNILFANNDNDTTSIDEDSYQHALSCCALRHDLELLPAGDATEIGEKGITLSGGQKARVALARAVYHNADMALLDDPLAAVDAHVGKHLFQKCIVDELLLQKRKEEGNKKRRRTVILTTNAIHYLSNPNVDRILVVRDGKIIESGTYKELSSNVASTFTRFLNVLAETGVASHSLTTTTNTDTTTTTTLDAEPTTTTTKSDSTDSSTALNVAIKRELKRQGSSLVKDDNNGPPPPATSGTLMTDEAKERATGHVNRDVYLAWGRAAGGVWVPFVIIFAYGAVECMNVLSKWWLTYWSQHGSGGQQAKFLAIYAAINFSSVLATFLRLILLMGCGLKASRKLFIKLLDVIMRAPMSFFDTTPIGRIINRFNKDMNTVDSALINTLRSYLATLFTVISTIIVISGVTPIFTICLIPIIIYYIIQQKYFTSTYRELKRLDSLGRSPIFALLGETLDGVTTIRAYLAQSSLITRLTHMLDRQQRAYYLTFAAQCWLAVRLELVGTIIITCACLSSVLQHGKKGGDETFAGLAGLAISFSLSVTQSLNWSVRMASDFEANMVAVERIENYCHIQSEAKRHTMADTSSLLPKNWPEKGEIKFVHAKLRYRRGLPLVLKGLDIDIPAGSKVGVVGRTGAGKSTLMIALLRIVELSSGKIYIDGVDHRIIGLAKLRSKIAVIPQDPVLFSGTVRTNLDPFDDFTDEKLYEVLTRVGLYSINPISRAASTTSLASMANIAVQSLTDHVADGGSNFSVGQRQLLVIARALLCGASIVIMDEATAAVDADTDARIQTVMRSEFKGATCLTVAHRINTIMDSDYILVMDDGRAAEFDSPAKLMERRGGMFRELVEASAEGEGEGVHD